MPVSGDGGHRPCSLNDSYKEFAYGAYSLISSPFFRKIGGEPEIRDDGAHASVNETIDQSVFERWRAVPEYRPPNLLEWVNRKKVDPAKLTNSVRTDDPTVAAPD
jgi:hypothetical protein